MNITHSLDRARRDRWSSLLGWMVAATLACASSVAIAAIQSPLGETREWIEFRAASGIGLLDGTWLEAPHGGYADLSGAHDRRAERRTVSASESTYVDLRGSSH